MGSRSFQVVESEQDSKLTILADIMVLRSPVQSRAFTMFYPTVSQAFLQDHKTKDMLSRSMSNPELNCGTCE